MPALTYWQQFSLLLLQKAKPLLSGKIVGAARINITAAPQPETTSQQPPNGTAMREKVWLLFLISSF